MEDNAIMQLVESRRQQMLDKNKVVLESWSEYLDAIDEHLQAREGRKLDRYGRMNIARCLENAAIDTSLKSKKRLEETTFQSDIAFLGIQLPVIAAVLPSLAINDVAITQALDRRQGAVFYMNIQYDRAKGSIAVGDTMMGAKTGHSRTRAENQYATNRIPAEALGNSTGGGALSAKTLARKPVIAGTVVLTDGTNTVTDDGDGVLLKATAEVGTVDYTTGEVEVTEAGTFANTTAVTATYRFDMGRDTDGVGAVKFHLTSETISAEDFKLRSDYELGAAVDLEKAHGIVFENEVVKYLGAEIKFELDQMGLNEIRAASLDPSSAGEITEWDAKVQEGKEWVWKKYQFLDRIEQGSNLVFDKTLRCQPTYIVGGLNLKRILRQLKPDFEPASIDSKTPAGPHKIGKLNGLDVLVNPFFDTNEYVMGFKGDSLLYGGFLFAPYIPLITTPTLTTADLHAQKGFYSAAGFKVVNVGMFAHGTVTNVGLDATS